MNHQNSILSLDTVFPNDVIFPRETSVSQHKPAAVAAPKQIDKATIAAWGILVSSVAAFLAAVNIAIF